MAWLDDQLLPISALQHLLYCPRQCALIHVERLWAENQFTVEGRHLHQRADAGRAQRRDGRRTERGAAVWSCQLGLFGKADVIEFRPPPPPLSTQHSQLSTGNGVPFPVEYKRGKPKSHDADRVQLCAQAMCLEEMLGAAVPAGALFYGKTRRRLDVSFDAGLRELTRETAQRLHELIASGVTPAAVYEKKKCDRCSLKNLCLPRMPAARATRYLERSMAQALAAAGAGPVSD